MGKAILIRSIRKNAVRTLLFSILFGIFVAARAYLQLNNEQHDIFFYIISASFAVMAFVAIYLFLDSIFLLLFPTRKRSVRKNPQIINMVMELYENQTYQNKFIICSNRIIANAGDPSEIAFVDEVFQIYEKNVGRSNKILILKTARGKIQLNMVGERQAVIDEVKLQIRNRCRYAFLGNRKSGHVHYKKMMKLWKENEARKNGYLVK